MLAAKDKEIRFIHEAHIVGEGALKDTFLNVWKSFFEKDRWFRLSNMELSTWIPEMHQWMKAKSGEFFMKIGYSPGSDIKICSRETHLHIGSNGTIALEEFTVYTVDSSGDKPSIVFFDKTLFDRMKYFGSMAATLFDEGFGAKTVEIKSTLMLSDIPDQDKTLKIYNKQGVQVPLRLDKAKAIFSSRWDVDAVRAAARDLQKQETLDLNAELKLED